MNQLWQAVVGRRRKLIPFCSGAVRAVILCVSLFLAWMYVGFVRAPAAGTYHDDGLYIVTARALAEGHGYRIISIPGEPPQTKYPILFPWLVSLVWRVYPSFPENLSWLRMVPLGATMAWLWLSWRLLLRLGASRREAAVVVLLTVASPWVAFLSTTLLSETLLAALLTGTLLVITRLCVGDGRQFDGVLAGFLAGCCLLTRAAGAAPAAAGLVALAAGRRWNACAQYAGGVLVMALLWFWWVVRHNAAASSLDAYYSVANYNSWNIISSYALSDKLVVLGLNAVYFLLAFGQFWGLGRSLATLAPPAACAFVMSKGLWRVRTQPVAVFVGFYLVMVLAWVWVPWRFLVPILPLLIWLTLVGAGRLRPFCMALALVLLAVGGFHLWRLSADVRERGTMWPTSGEAEDWHAMERMFQWIRRETPHDAVLTGNLDPAYYLFTGRQAVRAFSSDPFLLYYNVGARRRQSPIGTMEDFKRRLVRIKADYLIMTPGGGFAETPYLRLLVSALTTAFPGGISPVYGSAASGYMVYRIDRVRLQVASTSVGESTNAVSLRPE